MTIDYPAVAEDVHRRYPFFRSTLFERRMLFERAPAAVSRNDKPGQDLSQAPNQDQNQGQQQDHLQNQREEQRQERRSSPDRPVHDRLAPFAELEIACGA